MAEEGNRIQFDDKGPYLFQVLNEQPEAMLLDEHNVCLLKFNELYLPIDATVCPAMADAMVNMSQSAVGPEKEGMVPIEFDLTETTELPLVSGVASESFQHNDMIYMDVMFGETQARLCFTIMTAAQIGQILSQIPKD